MSDLKLKDLRYLVAVADTLHFGRAAAKCFVSQPTLSAQLRKLEEYLGVQLIERQPRRIALTQAGEEIARRARTMLESSDAIMGMAQSRRDPLAGQLRVALLPTIGPYLLPNVVLKMQKALPQLDLLLYEYQTEPMLEHLQQGEIDMGILALPVHVDGLVARELYQEPFVAALPAQHRLASRNRLRIEDLQGETLLLLEDGHCLRDQALAVCSRIATHEKQDFRATSIETLRQMVAAGAGVTLLPELASMGSYGAIKGLSIVPFSRPVPTRTIGAVWRKSTARATAIEAVCEQLQRHHGLSA
jgi:LysR family transcriptional regulator, hydrogen peroxide-inducible genes activator